MNRAQAEVVASDVATVAGNHASVGAFIALRQRGYDLSPDAQKKLSKAIADLVGRLASRQDPNIVHVPLPREFDRRKPR